MSGSTVLCQDLQTNNFCSVGVLSLISAPHTWTCQQTPVLFLHCPEFLCSHLPPMSICLAFSSDAPSHCSTGTAPAYRRGISSYPRVFLLIYSYTVKSLFVRDKQGATNKPPVLHLPCSVLQQRHQKSIVFVGKHKKRNIFSTKGFLIKLLKRQPL